MQQWEECVRCSSFTSLEGHNLVSGLRIENWKKKYKNPSFSSAVISHIGRYAELCATDRVMAETGWRLRTMCYRPCDVCDELLQTFDTVGRSNTCVYCEVFHHVEVSTHLISKSFIPHTVMLIMLPVNQSWTTHKHLFLWPWHTSFT